MKGGGEMKLRRWICFLLCLVLTVCLCAPALADGELFIVKDMDFEKPCTKDAVALIKALGLEGKRICVVIGNEDIEAFLSFRNIPEVNILPVGDINTYELVDNKALVIAEPCLACIEEVLA